MSLNFNKIEQEMRVGLHRANRELARQLGLPTEHWDCLCGLYNHCEKIPPSLTELHQHFSQELREHIQKNHSPLEKLVGWL